MGFTNSIGRRCIASDYSLCSENYGRMFDGDMPAELGAWLAAMAEGYVFFYSAVEYGAKGVSEYERQVIGNDVRIAHGLIAAGLRQSDDGESR